MIYPQNNRLIYGFFQRYIPRIIRRNFKEVNFNSVEIDQNKSVLLLANHFSWWDAFLLYFVFAKLTGKKLHVMVLEDTMKKQWFFKYIGAFSVNKTPHGVINALNYAAQLLNDPQNLVLIFPQGKLCSNFVNEVQFEKGVMKIMDQAAGRFQLIYAAAFVENLQYEKPMANVYLSIPVNCTFENIEALTQSYQQHYNDARLLQTKIIL
jgi:1-acyl-sn-glycerol-3-phosphate acyltransferase